MHGVALATAPMKPAALGPLAGRAQRPLCRARPVAGRSANRQAFRVQAIAEADRSTTDSNNSAGVVASVSVDNKAHPDWTLLVVQGPNRPGE